MITSSLAWREVNLSGMLREKEELRQDGAGVGDHRRAEMTERIILLESSPRTRFANFPARLLGLRTGYSHSLARPGSAPQQPFPTYRN